MREQLARNNQALWKTVEEEKMLRAAIAHDIRAPLSVLKGYQEMLTEYLPAKMPIWNRQWKCCQKADARLNVWMPL